MSQFDLTNFVRFILDTEDDSESPHNEEYAQELRILIETLFILLFDTGVSGTLTADPPDDNTGKLEDTAAGFADDEYNGLTLLITSGTAKGLFYTIDDVIAADDALYCTGDNLYADGVRSGDSYKIFYDLLTNLDGHDHDGYNSKGGTVADSAISQAKLKTTTGSVSTPGGTPANLTLPGGEYGFRDQIKCAGNLTAAIANSKTSGSYVTNVYLTCGTHPSYAQQRYVQASGEVFWIFILRDKITKEIGPMGQGPDHPCMGNGGKPLLVPHPFGDYDKVKYELIVVNPDQEEVLAMQKACVVDDEKTPDRDMRDVILEDYEIDELTEADWPEEEVTVALPKDWEDAWLSKRPVTPIKKKIPKPDGVLCRKLRKLIHLR